MRTRLALTAAVLVMATVACNGPDEPSGAMGATVPTEPPRTTTTDPFAIPATIDAAYVNRVLAGLDAAVGDVVRIVVSTKFIPREAYDRLRALYADDAILQSKIDNYQADIRGGLSGYRSPPGNKRSEVLEMLAASTGCIYARVRRDYSAVSFNPIPDIAVQWVAIRPFDAARDPSRFNTVGWAFTYEGFERGFVAPRVNPCSTG
ncbi:MAG: hypothetical protein ACRD2W_09755 [Acidimicrobiales bacterium]